jgi:hypothetical protein
MSAEKFFFTHFLQQILIIVYDYNLLTMVLIMSVALSLLMVSCGGDRLTQRVAAAVL